MRIAVVHSFYSRKEPSGENTVVLDQVAELRAAGHEVLLLARHTDDESDNFLYEFRSAWTTISGFGPSPSKVLHQFAPDVVHVHNTFPNWGTKWLSRWGHRTVMTLHNFRSLCANGLQFRDGHSCHDCLLTPVTPAVRNRCYRSSTMASLAVGIGSSPFGALRSAPEACAAVIALSSEAAQMFEGELGRTVNVIPNFVPRPGTPATEIRPTGWAYIGRLSREKGVDRLLDSWPAGERLDLIGEGALSESVNEAAERNPGIRNLGLMPRADVMHRLGSYEGLLLPSMAPEQLPTVVLEALASRVPCMLSMHVAAARDLAKNGAAVIFDPSAGETELSARLQSVRAEHASMSEAARRIYDCRYSPEAWRDRVEDLYRRVRQRADGRRG